jgi:hypothetical protein
VIFSSTLASAAAIFSFYSAISARNSSTLAIASSEATTAAVTPDSLFWMRMSNPSIVCSKALKRSSKSAGISALPLSPAITYGSSFHTRSPSPIFNLALLLSSNSIAGSPFRRINSSSTVAQLIAVSLRRIILPVLSS